MSNLWIVNSALWVIFSAIYADDFGEGIWEPISIEKCEEQDHKFKYDLQLMKLNNTHDVVRGRVILEETFTEDFGIRIVLNKCQGDKCEQYQMIQEICLFDFLKNYVRDDLEGLLVACGVDPPDVPIEKGEYVIDDYVFAKRQGIGMYGSFVLKSFVLEEEKEVGCIGVTVEFNKLEDL